jgi:predicted  nucleic acid-binding Zn-ribbon protein
MKRLRIFGVALFLCAMLVGCESRDRGGLLTGVIQRLNLASSEVGIIATKVKDATEEAKKGKKLDLSEAVKAADKLKETGTKIVEIRQQIDRAKDSITAEEKQEYAKDQQENLNKAFKTLLQNQQDLRDALAEAEKIDKTKTDELRKKLDDAVGPFQAQTKVSRTN